MYLNFIRAYIESVLGAYVTRFPVSRVEFLGNVNEHAKALHEAYEIAYTGKAKVEYSNLFCRLAFLYMYGAMHATLVERVLQFSPNIDSKILGGWRNRVRIVSIGGGPTAELLGMSKRIISVGPLGDIRIEFTCIDAVAKWEGIGRLIADRLNAQFTNPIFTYNFICHTMQSISDFPCRVENALAEADIVLFSYFFSDVTAENDASKNAKLVERLMAITPDSCTFIVIDLNYVKGKVLSAFKELKKKNMDKISFSLDNSERKETLTEIFRDTGIENPMIPEMKPCAFGLVIEKMSAN